MARLLSSSSTLFFVLFHMGFIVLASNVKASTAFGFTNKTDRQALLAIKDQILEDPYRVLSSWNDSVHFCNWQGVTCSHRHQRVTILNLSSKNFVGSISPHIGNLTFLRGIYLQNNSFHGTIPPEIGRLSRLQQLWININSFQGEFPTNLTSCLNLRVINISKNNLGGKIPSKLGSLSNLFGLNLFMNHFTGNIPPSLGNLSALRILNLNKNNLEGSIPFEFGQLLNLQILQLSTNNLSGVVPIPLYNISSIIFFVLALNQLHGSLPPDLGLTLPNLQQILLGINQFSGTIPPSLVNASRIISIDIFRNAFTGPVPMNLGSLLYLDWLDFGVNTLGTNQDNDLSFINSLVNRTNLRSLILSDNNFRCQLPNSIGNLSSKLTTLSVSNNSIYGIIPEGIGNLINLESLGLAENMFTGSIPRYIGKLSKLIQLFLPENNISGKIPTSIGNISRLSFLSISVDMLEGSIPVSLGDCKDLQALDLGYNRLTGQIPLQVLDLSSLSIVLVLRHNHLTGPLPPQVGNLKNLAVLDISGNKLSGEIPSTLGDCLVLQLLLMDGNLFEGTLPSSLKQLRGIDVLDLSRNNFSGEIPSFLGEFPFIQNLNLSYNSFEGVVPSEGVFMNTTVFSILGNNKLCGGIKALKLPECPAKFSDKKAELSGHGLIIIVISITLSVALLIACVCAILCRTKKTKGRSYSDLQLGNWYPTLSYAELLQATNGFSTSNLIGQGRYGSVYKGILKLSEQEVAVKVLNLQQRGADKSFLAECETMKNIRHRNLLKIITSCSSICFKGNDFKALVFEFMPNGSLESWLHPNFSEQQNSKYLDLIARLNIAIDVASALDYLHHHCGRTIIHCDLKPSNVLLDKELCAHVGDFGLARSFLTTDEYGMGANVSTQGDVYSFGILLLEMFTGKNPTNSMFTNNLSPHNYAKTALPDRVMAITDSELRSGFVAASIRTSQCNIVRLEECLVSIFQIGVICSAELASERMDIRDVLLELHMIRNLFLQKEERV
ncbi:putative receptor-like protein kinase At3g47110 [Cornus florida]|uniref:putative receptor-like protein kinase At3g47110 n=1 Tax=Cornus florida TaxID=4283 RepID=UPI00289DF796|nr:putative receptor-like protein kinase At3g47110 [Cornus florida]